MAVILQMIFSNTVSFIKNCYVSIQISSIYVFLNGPTNNKLAQILVFNLLPVMCQTITWTNADLLSTKPLNQNRKFLYMKMHLNFAQAIVCEANPGIKSW